MDVMPVKIFVNHLGYRPEDTSKRQWCRETVIMPNFLSFISMPWAIMK